MPESEKELIAGSAIDCERVAAELLVDQYVLGHLSAEKIEAFEDHYMMCPACAKEVEEASLMGKGLRRVAADGLASDGLADGGGDTPTSQPIDISTDNVARMEDFKTRKAAVAPASARWNGIGRVGSLIAAALAGVVLTLPFWSERGVAPTPETAAVSVFHLQPERSVETEPSRLLRLPSDGSEVVLALELSAPFYDAYETSLESAGRVLWQADGLALGERETLHLQLPRDLLTAGDFLMIVSGQNGDVGGEVGRFAFRIE